MRKQCKRKVWALVNPINHAITGASITAETDLDRLRMIELSAIESFRMGKATEDEWSQLAGMLNLAEVMGDDSGTILAAQEALKQAKRRQDEGKTLGLTGPELEALRKAYAVHEQQRTGISRKEYEESIRKTVNKVKGVRVFPNTQSVCGQL